MCFSNTLIPWRLVIYEKVRENKDEIYAPKRYTQLPKPVENH